MANEEVVLEENLYISRLNKIRARLLDQDEDRTACPAELQLLSRVSSERKGRSRSACSI